jgi:hypothetical protein
MLQPIRGARDYARQTRSHMKLVNEYLEVERDQGIRIDALRRVAQYAVRNFCPRSAVRAERIVTSVASRFRDDVPDYFNGRAVRNEGIHGVRSVCRRKPIGR